MITAATELCDAVKEAISTAAGGWLAPVTDIIAQIASAVTLGGAEVTTNNTTWCDNSTSAIETGAGSWVAPVTDGMNSVAAAVVTGGETSTANTTTWCGNATAAIKALVPSWGTETTSGMDTVAAAVTTGGETSTANTSTWCGNITAKIKSLVPGWGSETTSGMGTVSAAVTTGGATAVANTGTWCGNVALAIGAGGTSWISKMSAGMGGVVEAVTSGGASAVTSTKLWTADAGGVIDTWAASAQSSVASVGRSIDDMNAKIAEQEREAGRISERDDNGEYNRSDEWVDVEGIIIESSGADESGASARGWNPTQDKKWEGGTTDTRLDLLTGASGQGLWFTEYAWDQLTSAEQDALRESTKGLVSNDLKSVVEEFASGGFIPRDMYAKVHAGEFVVPKRSVDDFINGPRGVTINNHYNIGNVYGVDDLNRLLDEHDRKITRSLRMLI